MDRILYNPTLRKFLNLFRRDRNVEACLRRALVRLGNTKHAILATLIKLHITGIREDSNKCPVAQYLKQMCGVEVDVMGSYLTWNDNDEYTHKIHFISPAISNFISDFDDGAYPDLEDYEG